MGMKKEKGGLVYSTEQGRTCPGCENPITECRCLSKEPVPSRDGIVRISRESKGRKGKTVTLVKGIPLPRTELALLCKELKRQCGTGGTLKSDIIELQGEQWDRLNRIFKQRGWVVKRVGG